MPDRSESGLLSFEVRNTHVAVEKIIIRLPFWVYFSKQFKLAERFKVLITRNIHFFLKMKTRSKRTRNVW